MSNYSVGQIEDFAEIFKALSNPNRLKIFLSLTSCCKPGTVGVIDRDCSVYIGELADEVAVVKSTVSHHIKELKRVGLIKTERQGQKIACWVDPEMVEALHRFFKF
ncbi:MAG: winged helix-turn-helix transcriptional regulator [Desulfofustis sp.]|nr:metalloregulator ArsR/SmtB family transcription factor [Desulfofustis sp.]RZW17790.1 MAG: ArsR family transcriptional regulator [Desulfobulbaceae bacterium]MBT8345799.1 metalloregulator ArsR/SmtB family transcription factor [Desulfofustis sp.]NNF46896.1 winged helix-turn-helix transcriptional regulator [Desulfofustis sp.]NNK14336.1 winged helix-turn-helix transcriptional regulator [Desulfofustis sp.]